MAKNDENSEAQQAAVLAELRAKPRPRMDFTTPEGAILCLEDAYRRKDIAAAIACKDFLVEATLMLLEIDEDMAADSSVRAETARVLEEGFRKEKTEAWPDMRGVESFFIAQHPLTDGIVVVEEFLWWPDGSFEEVYLRVADTENGWRVLDPFSPDDEEPEQD